MAFRGWMSQVVVGLLFSAVALADGAGVRGAAHAPYAKVPSLNTIQVSLEKNQAKAAAPTLIYGFMTPFNLPTPPAAQPRAYAEFETARIFFMSADTDFSSLSAKRTMVQQMPSDVQVAILYNGVGEGQYAKANFDHLRASGETKFLNLGGGDFWARDALPIPVLSGNSLSLIDAEYYHPWSRDEELADTLGVPVYAHGYGYEGGNFVADAQGNCIQVQKHIPKDVMRDYYGCVNTVYLPLVSGIGHADEHVKLLSNSMALTDLNEYVQPLQDMGYHVTMLPKAGGYRTYVNSLLVNGTLFMPAYGTPTDEVAAQVYRDFGYTVFKLPSNQLSDNGLGSIHCITMTYPLVSL